MILFLTQARDEHANHVEPRLRGRGASIVRFDPAEFPRAAEITLDISAAGWNRCVLRTAAGEVDLGGVRAAWYRRPNIPTAHDEIGDGPTRRYVEQESIEFLQDVWNSLDCPWLPAAPFAVQRASTKGMQLKLAAKLGFDVPPTVVTNGPGDLLEFYRKHNGHIISKVATDAIARSVNEALATKFVRYTELVTTRDIGYAHESRYCPMIYQAYVPKQIEVRITVVGDRAFPAEIHSQATNHTRFDWRRYDRHHTRVCPHQLPADLERRCIALVKRLGLSYGAIDMALTPSGQYVFFEINPNGQYLWLEQLAGLPISDAICDLLMAGSEA